MKGFDLDVDSLHIGRACTPEEPPQEEQHPHHPDSEADKQVELDCILNRDEDPDSRPAVTCPMSVREVMKPRPPDSSGYRRSQGDTQNQWGVQSAK